MSDPNYTDAQLILAYSDLETQREAIVKQHKTELEPYVNAIAAVKAEMLLRMQERSTPEARLTSISVEGAGTAYQQNHLSVKVDNQDEFLAWINANPSNRLNYLDVGVLKEPVKEWFALQDANGQPVNTEPPPGLKAEWFTKLNIRRT